MARCRSLQTFPINNISFVLVVITLIVTFGLAIYEFFFRQNNIGIVFFLVVVLYLMAMWSYFTAVFSDPGRVPVYYGLYSEHLPG